MKKHQEERPQKPRIEIFEYRFHWTKPTGEGFHWEKCDVYSPGIGYGYISSPEVGRRIPDPPYLVPKNFFQGRLHYDPMEETTTFASFGDLAGDNESFLQWANEHGMLTEGKSLTSAYGLDDTLFLLPKSVNPLPKQYAGVQIQEQNIRMDFYGDGFLWRFKDGHMGYVSPGESIELWVNEHQSFSIAFLLWELVSDKDSVGLDKVIQREPDGRGITLYRVQRTKLGDIDRETMQNDSDYRKENGIYKYIYCNERENISPFLAEYLYRAPNEAIAQAYLHETISHKLRIYPLKIYLGEGVPESFPLHFILHPTSLLSAMWFQMALTVRGSIKIKRCSVCGEWEDMGGHRENWSQHKTCANKERARRHRKKHQEEESKRKTPLTDAP
jgi:hypothetical protein